jgi:hypothetical protein
VATVTAATEAAADRQRAALNWYLGYLQRLNAVADSLWLRRLCWLGCCLALGCGCWLLWQQAAGIRLVPVLLLLCWCLLGLFVTYSLPLCPPQLYGRRWSDWCRLQWYRLRLHSLALLILVLVLLSGLTSLKMISVLLRQG